MPRTRCQCLTRSPRAPTSLRAMRRTLVPALLMCSLLVNGVLTAVLVSRVDNEGAAVVVAQTVPRVTRAATVATATANAVTTVGRAARDGAATETAQLHAQRRARASTRTRPTARATTTRTVRRRNAPAVPRPSRASVERRLMLLLLEPHANVPRRFVDQRTGLVKNNVQVACKRR